MIFSYFLAVAGTRSANPRPCFDKVFQHLILLVALSNDVAILVSNLTFAIGQNNTLYTTHFIGMLRNIAKINNTASASGLTRNSPGVPKRAATASEPLHTHLNFATDNISQNRNRSIQELRRDILATCNNTRCVESHLILLGRSISTNIVANFPIIWADRSTFARSTASTPEGDSCAFARQIGCLLCCMCFSSFTFLNSF